MTKNRGLNESNKKTYHASIVKEHIKCISQLTAHSRKPQDWIRALCIARHGCRLEMLDKLAHAHQLARLSECLLGRFKWRYRRRWPVRAVQVPC